jgi:hypothetical protein
MKRFLLVLALGMLSIPAAAGAATTTYASPTGGEGPECDQANPCTLPLAIELSTAEVVVTAGDYTVDFTQIIDTALDVHGPETGPRPTVNSGGLFEAIRLENPGAKLRKMTVFGLYNAVTLGGGSMDSVFAHTSEEGTTACSVREGTSTITNSVCWAPAGWSGIGDNFPEGNLTLNLRNVTAIGGRSGIDFDALDFPITVTGSNVIARHGAGGSPRPDIRGDASPSSLTMTFDYSNYGSRAATGNSSITDPAAGNGNQTASPVFVNAAAGDFHQTAASPTIDAGVIALASSLTDFEGDAREQGPSADIGADELPNPSPNADPVAVNDSATVSQDSPPTPIDVLVNDTDTDGGAKFITSATDPPHGSISASPTILRYEPDPGFCGADTVDYTVNRESTATVAITVTCLPTAVADSATVERNSAATTIDVLANDTDPDGGPKAITGASEPPHGTAVTSPESLTYQPNPGYCGSDSFQYTLNGGSTATVTITIPCPPTAVNDSATVAKGAAATPINVLANDTDPDGGPKSLDSATDPPHGAVVSTPLSLTYQPDPAYCGPDSFTYSLNGGSTATVSVTVICPDTTAPNTRFIKKPPLRTRNRLAKFRFASTEPSSTFRCKVDKRAWRSCKAAFQTRVKPGKHVIRVGSRDQAGNLDKTPAIFRWRVQRG